MNKEQMVARVEAAGFVILQDKTEQEEAPTGAARPIEPLISTITNMCLVRPYYSAKSRYEARVGRNWCLELRNTLKYAKEPSSDESLFASFRAFRS